ncbi:MAG TPA: two-component regulator propeller domain-containing protein [Verrucomicrobiae bacterium]|jgi:signal transduction histidine kinase/ligand-binding sensor domain-containing protein|nr:two-component regulator propeller domain-containing protein [Verrucomicrobiae bacterium]
MPRFPAWTFSFRRTLLALALLTVSVFPVLAAPPHYFARTWQVENGLPQNKVTAVLQTRDGYLWVGTYNGLARFDGAEFKVFDDNNTPQLHSSRITSLCEARDGTLWIGDESGQITQYKNGQFAAFPFHSKWSWGRIYRIVTDDSGDVWFMNEAGELARARDGAFLAPRAGSIVKVVALARSADGTIWIARNGAVSMLRHGRLTDLSIDAYIQGICASSDGGLWVANNAVLREWKNGQWIKDLGTSPWGWPIISEFIQLANGALAAGSTDGGLYLVFPDRPGKFVRFDRANGFPSDWVISLCQDREGNLWSGTGAGLVMVHPGNLEIVSPPDQWQGRAVLAVCAGSNDDLWAGTEGAGLYRFQNGAWTNYETAQGIRNLYIWSLAEDRKGRLYAGSWGGGLFAQKDGAFDFAPGIKNVTLPMPALLSEPDGLWIGTTEGLLHYQNNLALRFSTGHGLFSSDVRALARDASGAIWAGTAGNGLDCIRNNTVRQFGRSDGLSSDFIECLRFDQDGTLWIGTFGGGLNRFKNGRFSVINGKNGLPNNVICDIEQDGQGFFWMSSYGGIIRVSEEELNKCADGKAKRVSCRVYGINDGLPTLQCSEGLQPAGCRTADGRLWFPTARGLVSVDPAGVTINPLPPPIVIEEMRVDDHKFAPVSSAENALRIPPGRHRFDFQYTALSFIVPEKVQFKCRLVGLDEGWVDMGTKRLATYSYIPPGDYSFQVTACNNDGVWNQEGASMTFRVLPYFWQTAWFRLVALGALLTASGALVWFDTRRRMRRRLELVERQRDIESERTRIARDIHDDLGSHLTRITMISESARGDSGNPGRMVGGLEQIYGIAHQLTQSMDEIVWAVSPRHDTLESLAAYLEKFAQDLLAAAGVRCRIDMPMQLPEWHLTSEIRHNLFLACKEAFHNVVKHSAASEVFVRLLIAEKSFSLSIEDNGCGFSAETRHQTQSSGRVLSGNGLDNMVRRLSAIGGKCDIQSHPGKGTKITFTVGSH